MGYLASKPKANIAKSIDKVIDKLDDPLIPYVLSQDSFAQFMRYPVEEL